MADTSFYRSSDTRNDRAPPMSYLTVARDQIRNSRATYLGDKNREELRWAPVRQGHDQVVRPDISSEEPTILYVIVHLSERNYRMNSCGMWGDHYDFDQAKATALAEDPSYLEPELRGDIDNVRQAIYDLVFAKLQQFPADHRYANRQTNPVSLGGPTGIRIQHRLFRKKFDGYREFHPDSDPRFQIESWPTDLAEHEAKICDIVNSHVVVPLPAYGIDKMRIQPMQYEQHLKGAVVRVGFVLNHYHPLGGKHRFTADVHHILVLSPPPSVAVPSPQAPLVPYSKASYKREYDEVKEEECDPSLGRLQKYSRSASPFIKHEVY